MEIGKSISAAGTDGPVMGQPSADQRSDRIQIAGRLGVRGEFVRVPQLSKALGISSNSIHSQIRLGTFPMPHRKVGSVVVVKLDDYVAWFNASGDSGPLRASSSAVAAPDPDRASRPPCDRPTRPPESPQEFRERLDRQVLRGMRAKGFDV